MRGSAVGAVVLALLSACAADAVCQQVPGAQPARPLMPGGRLRVHDRQIVYPDGTIFRWRGVTAFALLEQIAHGREADAAAYMRWARDTGFNLVRVLAMADNLFRLAPDEGRQHLPRLLTLAAEHGLYVEIVALADTANYRMTRTGLRAQVTAIGAIAAAHENSVVQVANEHYHPSQTPDVHDPAVLRDLAGLLPPQVLHTESAAAEDTAAEPQGQFITRHLSRNGTPASMAAQVAELGSLSVRMGKPVVNDEPIGADERSVPGRRLADPDAFRAISRKEREAGLAGGTFHCEDCLYGRIPGSVQRACARAWIEGAGVSGPSGRRSP
jgi:hypothetical protein